MMFLRDFPEYTWGTQVTVRTGIYRRDMLSLLPTFARAVGSIPFVEENVENRLSHHNIAIEGHDPSQ